MNNEIAKVTLFGRLGTDPELKYTKNSKAICKFSVAVSINKNEVDWKNVVVWEKQAEDCQLFLKKGSQVFVRGRMKESSYEKDGRPTKYIEVVADTVGYTNLRE
tara:strand:+ start:290 stop:601 length:312 start_codon:yes stop_codon:yes gene_type:complete